MNKQLKISLLLLSTLIIGMMIGFLVSGRLVSNRIENMRNNYSETGFGREIKRIIQPTPEQQEKLRPVFQEFAEKNRELMGDMHENQKELFIELKKDLSHILDDNQIKRLEDHWKNRKRWNDGRKEKRNNRPRHNR